MIIYKAKCACDTTTYNFDCCVCVCVCVCVHTLVNVHYVHMYSVTCTMISHSIPLSIDDRTPTLYGTLSMLSMLYVSNHLQYLALPPPT